MPDQDFGYPWIARTTTTIIGAARDLEEAVRLAQEEQMRGTQYTWIQSGENCWVATCGHLRTKRTFFPTTIPIEDE